jgi:hypothetical protein
MRRCGARYQAQLFIDILVVSPFQLYILDGASITIGRNARKNALYHIADGAT